MLVVAAVLGALLVAGFLTLRVAGGGRFPWFAFYSKGKESGFTFREISLLRKVAVESRSDQPTALFWSLKQLDRSVRDILIKLRANAREDNPEANALLTKLFELRKRLEFDLPKYKMGIKSSRSIMVRQRVRLALAGVGTFSSVVVENLARYMALSYPEGPQLPEGSTWKGQQVGVNFWRSEDAGYHFTGKVLNDFFDKQYPIIHLAHSDNLVRTQKRRSVRVPADLTAEIYALKVIEEANEMVEPARGLRCRVQDISEGGAAVLIGGRAKAGLPVKLQAELGGKTVVMPGVVKSATFDGKTSRSVLHVEAVPLTDITRNRILTYVYNLLGDREPTIAQKGQPTAHAKSGSQR